MPGTDTAGGGSDGSRKLCLVLGSYLPARSLRNVCCLSQFWQDSIPRLVLEPHGAQYFTEYTPAHHLATSRRVDRG
eukprot:819987-Rhodomonas_salina.2